MRKQYPIYNKNYNSIHNKVINNVNMSGDYCSFKGKSIIIDNAIKIEDKFDLCDLTIIDFQDILDTNIINTDCFENLTWKVGLIENQTIIYTEILSINNSLLDLLPTDIDIIAIIKNILLINNYIFTDNEGVITIDKKKGIEYFDIIIYNEVTIIEGCDEGVTESENSDVFQICNYDFDILDENSDGVFIIDNNTTNIEFDLSFTGDTINNTDETEFKYSIFKYNKTNNSFNKPSIYDSLYQSYSNISGGTVNIDIPVNNLNLDGEYIIKGYYKYPVCTLYSNKLGLEIDEYLIKTGSEYGMYSANEDWYFIAMKESQTPTILSINEPQIITPNNFNVSSYIPDFNGQNEFLLDYIPQADTIVSLNGLTLSNDEYLIDVDTLILSGVTFTTDTITVISVVTDDNFTSSNLYVENITINTSIQSGVTNSQLSNVFYNTTTSKYELFTEYVASDNSDIIITLNGITLANNIDYYRSITNNKRIILEGNLFLNDIITITYIKSIENINLDSGNNFIVTWSVENINPSEEGSFYIQIADLINPDFSIILEEIEVPYEPNTNIYSKEVQINGEFGDTYLYRVKNTKKYYTLNNQLVIDNKFSEVGKIKIQSNNQNTY